MKHHSHYFPSFPSHLCRALKIVKAKAAPKAKAVAAKSKPESGSQPNKRKTAVGESGDGGNATGSKGPGAKAKPTPEPPKKRLGRVRRTSPRKICDIEHLSQILAWHMV